MDKALGLPWRPAVDAQFQASGQFHFLNLVTGRRLV